MQKTFKEKLKKTLKMFKKRDKNKKKTFVNVIKTLPLLSVVQLHA